MPCSFLSCVCGTFVFQMRYLTAVYAFLTIIFCYIIRVAYHLAQRTMIQEANKVAWGERESAKIISSYYIGYLIGHVPGGMLADRYGARHVLSACLGTSVFLNFLTPLLAKEGHWWTICLIRCLMGIFQGPNYPATSCLLSAWIPKDEIGTIGAFTYAGSTIGSLLGNIVTGLLLELDHWQWQFYIWCSITLIFHVFFMLHLFSSPFTHPFITPEEKEYLTGLVETPKKHHPPWKDIFSDKIMYGLMAGQWGHDWIFFFIQTNLPTYIDRVMQFDIKSNGLITSMPYLAMFVTSVIVGKVSDILIKKEIIKRKAMRIINNTIGSVVPSICLVVIPLSSNKSFGIAMFVLCLFFKGFFYGGMKVNLNEMTVHYAGTLQGISNGFSSLTGFLSPLVVDHFIKGEEGTQAKWIPPVWIALTVCCGTHLIYAFLTEADRRPWDYVEGETRPDGTVVPPRTTTPKT